ncbi:uncharacterized protein LOC105282920 isoform X2 [Ooceraea biroi]|uniref:uncharacterized protein LOC105282920 isoform X2 n=1 Tax=Ooceraea biroi TaxID=2015173 RepID=UPI0005BC8624|nr:uncharacterized protein LOC105282920 isoform X2 [Ooceraea biroi]
MQRTLMVIWILVALTLPGFIHGRPAADDGRSVLSMFTAHASKLEDVLDYEQKPTSLFAQGGSLVPTKLRVNRSSDHRLSELETLMTMSKINSKRSPLPTGQASRQLDPARIGRRKRFIEKVPFEVIPIHQHTDRPKDEGNSAYSLIS